ncbi:putative organ specific protein [Helianthus annuus]|uniref:Organ specific protein n=1 Tax=Helianthus annuus TaxID=4232 RepID=A0A251TLT7_HELAN|nr:uncharacterized protein LOC110882856 [Helianthus annuus]KAF5787310.1 putative organ specific protein [Helianthus annuus]
MRSLTIFLFLFSLILIASLCDARADPDNYWKIVMKDKLMPTTFQDAQSQDTQRSSGADNYWKIVMKDELMPTMIQDAQSQDTQRSSNEDNKKDQLVTRFDTLPNLKIFTRDFNTKPNINDYHKPPRK